MPVSERAGLGEERQLAEIFAALRTSACFWYKRLYLIFPNPILCINGALAAGMPFTANAAEHVKCRATRCPCGRGDSELEAAAASWVVDATQVSMADLPILLRQSVDDA